LIYHEVVTMSKASVTFIKSQGSERYNQTAPVSAVGRKTETSMRARCLLGINARRDA
jgi:uroporphyrinogen-III synthase